MKKPKPKNAKPQSHTLTIRPNAEEWQKIQDLKNTLNKKFASDAIMIAVYQFPETRKNLWEAKAQNELLKNRIEELQEKILSLRNSIQNILKD